MAETKRRLGRGLDSLLSSTRLRAMENEAAGEEGVSSQLLVNTGDMRGLVAEVPLAAIHRNPHQPRQHWDEQRLLSLAESIKQNGVIQPVLLRPMGDGFQLIAGERRLRGTKLAGLATIPAIVRDATEEQMLEWALVENIHRADLNPIERARGYQRYLKQFSLTQETAAKRLGEDRSTIANYVRLLELSEELQQWMTEGRLSMGHGRALLGVTDAKLRLKLASLAIEQNWSVRQMERHLQEEKQQVGKADRKERQKDAHILDLEREMTRNIGSKVTIEERGRKKHQGKIVIEFYSLDDFDRIRERLMA